MKNAYSPLLGGVAPGVTVAATAITSAKLNTFDAPAVYVSRIVSLFGMLPAQAPFSPVLAFDVTTAGLKLERVTPPFGSLLRTMNAT